jgi:hypothetical protein
MPWVFFNKVGCSINQPPTEPGLPTIPPDILGSIQYEIERGVMWSFISICRLCGFV